MLVLTRRTGDKIHIGDDIVITVTRIKDNSVRIGVEAPPEVRILRDELYEAEHRPLPIPISPTINVNAVA